jgi:coenzyme F420 hydrogenase subunit beta
MSIEHRSVDHVPEEGSQGSGVRLAEIIEQGLCIGCGLCQTIAGAADVRMTMSGEGGERPAVVGTLDSAAMRIIAAVCPGIRSEGYVHATSGEAHREPPEIHPIWGPTRWMAIGHATDPHVRFHASSGGALTALATYLLETRSVDFILHVAASRQRPARTEQHLSFDAAQVIEGSGSRYGPAAPLTDFRAVLERGQPFAFIGKPCDITAIRNYAKLDPRVDELLRYTLNFYCGGASQFGKTMDYVRRSGLAEDDVAHLRYRGNGCPGPMVLKSRGGSVFSFGYNEMWDDENRWQLQFRCKICPDSLGDLADVSVADVWPGGKPDSEGLGFNGFIARTHRGLELLQRAIGDGVITITEPLDYAGLELAQRSQMTKKQAMTARLDAMRDAGLIVPDFSNLRLDEAAAMTDAATRQANYDGMRDRLRRGDNVEPLPDAAR